ncbi:MAG: hypothetical protein AAB361_02735 [Patescibacteria group bacterium]
MNIKIFKNKYLNALVLLMVVSVIIHMLILIFIAVKSLNIYILNYFNILDLDILFPGIFKNTPYGNLISVITALFLYFAILTVQDKNNN